jgi:hypothetical protein
MPAKDACYTVSWDEQTGLARIDWAPGTVCSLEEARAIDREIEAWGRGPVRCLVNLTGIETIDRPAREFFIHSPQYAAVALVAESAATRMLANFFLRLKRETTPARIFTDEAAAVGWLLAQP